MNPMNMRRSLKITLLAFFLTVSLAAFSEEFDIWQRINEAANNNDLPLAFLLAKPLADKGSAEAQNLVGSMFFMGKGVKQDEQKAVHYFKLCEGNYKSSDEIKSACFRMLSFAYVKGKGVSKDVNVGTNYLWRAAHLGDARATSSLLEIMCKNKDESCPSVLQEQMARCSELPCD